MVVALVQRALMLELQWAQVLGQLVLGQLVLRVLVQRVRVLVVQLPQEQLSVGNPR